MINQEADNNTVSGVATATAVAVPVNATPVTTGGSNAVDSLIVPAMKVHGKFTDGLFGKCCTCSGYCWLAWFGSWFCVPICCCQQVTAFARSADPRRNGHTNREQASSAAWGTLCCTFLLGLFIGPLFCLIYMLILRCKTRENVRRIYKIEGNCCFDCLIACCCEPCSVIQMAYQLWDNPADRPGCDCSNEAIHNVSSMPYGHDTPLRSDYDTNGSNNPMNQV